MQPCEVCGATGVDAGGYCEHCRVHRGAASYSVSPPAGVSPVSDAGAFYYSASPGVAGRASVGAYPAVTSGAPADAGYPPPVAAQPTRSPLAVPLFMLTVIVVVLVAGTVALVLIREQGRTAAQGANASQGASAPAPASSAPVSPSAAPNVAGAVDKCLLGEWTVISWRLPYGSTDGSGGEVATDNGGTIRFRADGTGEWDFGSGVKLVGSGPTRTISVRLTGRMTFSFRTTGQTFEFGEVRADVREEVIDGEKVIYAGAWNPQLGVLQYACAGDVFRWSPGTRYEARLQRRG